MGFPNGFSEHCQPPEAELHQHLQHAFPAHHARGVTGPHRGALSCWLSVPFSYLFAKSFFQIFLYIFLKKNYEFNFSTENIKYLVILRDLLMLFLSRRKQQPRPRSWSRRRGRRVAAAWPPLSGYSSSAYSWSEAHLQSHNRVSRSWMATSF